MSADAYSYPVLNEQILFALEHSFNQVVGYHRDKVFELFFKIHSSHEHAGKGVGLAVCKKIVEKHRGSIEAHSEPQKGVSIIIELPFTSE